MNDNVVNFPGTSHALKQASKGKQVTQEAAMNALVEMRKMFEGLMGSMGRLSQSQIQIEQTVARLDTNFGVLMRMLMDKGVFAEADWDTAWQLYVVKPQEEAMTKHIEQLKGSSAEDAYFGLVIEKLRSFEFAQREINGETIAGDAVRDFYMQLILNPGTRRRAVEDLRKKEITDLPEFDFVAADKAAKYEERKREAEEKMPECRYCGKPDCEFCAKLVEGSEG